MTFWVGPYEFPTRNVAVDHAKRLLRSKRPGADVSDFGLPLLDMHNRRDEKLNGRTPVAVIVTEFGGGAGKGFRARFDDGSSESFSYKACLFQPENDDRELRAVMRFEVRKQLRDFRNHADPLPNGEYGVVSYHPTPYHEIQEAFLAAEPVTCDLIRVGDGRWILADRDVAERWRAFHASRAGYRLLTATEHVEHSHQLNTQKAARGVSP